MKKFMSFLLSALLVLSLAACESNGGARSTASESSAGSTASSEAESSAAATEEATATPEPTEEPSAQPTLEETVLLDEGGIKVTATELTDYGLGGAPDLKLHVENNTDGDIMIQTSEYTAVNGCMVRGIASIQTSAGDSADDTVMFLDDEFEKAGIETVSDIKLAVRAVDADWNEICASDFVTVKTSAYGTVETPAVDGDVLYDEGGVKIVMLGTAEDEDFDFYFPTYVKLYIENNTDQDITVKTLINTYDVKQQFSQYMFEYDSKTEANHRWWTDKVKEIIEIGKKRNQVKDVDSEALSYAIWCFFRGYNADAVNRQLPKDVAVKDFLTVLQFLFYGVAKEQ